ncbi:MAG: type II toxin-antitoxin system VapC family toxin, partial [Candidatus Parabeggiatoa sp.]|nr:type II toxin-antitoxin system VapC family toxin [Candidatus Parabeggiatoa sp.]
MDSSAVIAILCDEPDAEHFATAIESHSTRLMSAASLLEVSIVIESRYGKEGGRQLDLLLSKAQVKIESVTFEQAEMARSAFRSYGKGRHPAALNFGDCFSLKLIKQPRVITCLTQ